VEPVVAAASPPLPPPESVVDPRKQSLGQKNHKNYDGA